MIIYVFRYNSMKIMLMFGLKQNLVPL